MADAEAVLALRQMIWDLPQWNLSETIGVGDGRRTAFQTAAAPVLDDSLRVWVDGEEVTESVTFDYSTGLITFPAAPAEDALLTADYAWAQLSDAALSSQLDAQAGNAELAAARCLEVLALDPAALLLLKIEGVAVDLSTRQAAVRDAILHYRQRGSYAAFQVRVDPAPNGGL